jgi:hypothetical protein
MGWKCIDSYSSRLSLPSFISIMQRLDLKDVNRFFNSPLPRPSPTKSFTVEDERWLQQFYARLHSRDGGSSDGSSPSSSSITLTNEDEDVFSTSKANKYHLWSEPVPDHQAANTWSKAQSQLASAKGPRYLPPPPSQAGFNPHAPPFVPSQQRQGPPSKPPHQPAMQLPEPPQSPRAQPSWYSPFMAGTSALSIEEQHAHAVGVVSHRPWTPESLAHLAQHFCWKGTKGMSKGNAGHKGQVVVSFVKVVVSEFGKSCGDWFASSFMWHLGECAVSTFKSCWKLVCLYSSSLFIGFNFFLSRDTCHAMALQWPSLLSARSLGLFIPIVSFRLRLSTYASLSSCRS